MGAIIAILTGILKFKSQRIYAFHCTKKQTLIKWNEMENRKSDTLFQSWNHELNIKLHPIVNA